MSAPDIDRIATLEAKPGDVLVLHCARPLTMEMAARLREHLADVTPAGIKAIVLDSGMSLHILRGLADGGSCPADANEEVA